MRKSLYILISIITIGCSTKRDLSQINQFVELIENRPDLIKTVSENKFHNNQGVNIGKSTQNTITDKNKELIKIEETISKTNNQITQHEFYYKNETLIYARILKIRMDLKRSDTLVNSELYFRNAELINEVHHKSKIESKRIQLLAESYTVKGLGSN